MLVCLKLAKLISPFTFSRRQVYLGGYEAEEAAAEAYDMAVLKTKGPGAYTNFPADRYSDLLASLGTITTEELIMAVRRQSQVTGATRDGRPALE